MKKTIEATRFILLILVGILFPLVNKGQTNLPPARRDIPVTEDVKRGNEAASKILAEVKVIKDAELTAYVSGLGLKVAGFLDPKHRIPEFTFSFTIVEDLQINAFALPGGRIFVHSGLLEKISTEGELAAVLAHEISHVVLRHGIGKEFRFKDSKPVEINKIITDPTVCAMLGGLCTVLANSQATSARSFLNVAFPCDWR